MTDLEQTTQPSPRPFRRHDGPCRFENRFRYLTTEVSCHCIALSRPQELADRLLGYVC